MNKTSVRTHFIWNQKRTQGSRRRYRLHPNTRALFYPPQFVGTDFRTIVDQTSRLLTDRAAYDQMARAINPYGDGKATGRILEACYGYIGKAP
jgi:hypothetical protein